MVLMPEQRLRCANRSNPACVMYQLLLMYETSPSATEKWYLSTSFRSSVSFSAATPAHFLLARFISARWQSGVRFIYPPTKRLVYTKRLVCQALVDFGGRRI